MVVQTTMLEQMRRQTEDIIRYYGELNRRVENTGINGIPGLLELSQQMETAVAVVAPQEIEWVVSEVRQLLEQLVRMDSQLQRLRELKMLLDAGSESDETSRRRSSP